MFSIKHHGSPRIRSIKLFEGFHGAVSHYFMLIIPINMPKIIWISIITVHPHTIYLPVWPIAWISVKNSCFCCLRSYTSLRCTRFQTSSGNGFCTSSPQTIICPFPLTSKLFKYLSSPALNKNIGSCLLLLFNPSLPILLLLLLPKILSKLLAKDLVFGPYCAKF